MPVDYDPFSPDTQRRLCQEAADRRGVKLVREFVDLDYSARKDIYRPGYEDGINALVNQEIEYLFVPTVDRFSRRGTAALAPSWSSGRRRLFGSLRRGSGHSAQSR